MDPIERFNELFAEARVAPCHDPTGMTLSTVDADGRPSARVVLLKGADADGFVFYTNTRSRKGRQLDANPHAALTLWWPHIGWQVRVEGRAARVTDAEADTYFATRARGSQLGAWASEQSDTLASRDELETRLAKLTTRFANQVVPRPPHWTGYRIAPTLIELWKNRADRLHERQEFRRASPALPWTMRLLNP
ncbi:MAG: pyridoxamine 5'-phosphate oxidase [Myxococcales bacterium]|nr:pyridoxamine 5'-phosphate oxidase [Myxococcales bacterium]